MNAAPLHFASRLSIVHYLFSSGIAPQIAAVATLAIAWCAP